MKQLPAGLQMHLDSGATTLCWCWRLTRLDGTVFGFTDHDRDLTFDGTTFEARAGFTATEIRDSVGLSVDNLEVESALSSDTLDEAGLASTKFDDAMIEIFRANWNAPAQHVLMRTGSIGEVRRHGGMFAAEVRGLAHYMGQPSGRLYQYTCDVDLGSPRCGIDLTVAPFKDVGQVVDVSSRRRFIVSGLSPCADGWFTRGLLTFTSGDNAGRRIEIKRHTASGATVTIELWQEASQPIVPGTTVQLTAGCDKAAATCTTKFANIGNFRGFPAMPGNDYLTTSASKRRIV
jgi:uncharacterized phage protein (TIGR02218 family)